MPFSVDPCADAPPSKQLVDAVLDELSRGALSAGCRLPSVRLMAQQALINPNTVSKAYRALEHLGVVRGRNGSGVFVTAEGPDLARDRRRRETLTAFAAIVQSALAAGHCADDLHAALEREARQSAPLAVTPGEGK